MGQLSEETFDGIDPRTRRKVTFPDLVDIGLSGLALCLFGGDIPEGGM